MRPAVKILLPFLLGAALVGGLWGWMAFQGRGERGELEEQLSACREVAGAADQANSKASAASAEAASCRKQLDELKATSKAGSWFCGLPDDKASACFASRAECEAQATACREQAFAVCAGEACFSDVWGCVKQASEGQACETRR